MQTMSTKLFLLIQKGLDDAIVNNQSIFTSTVNGLDFRVYVDLNTKKVRNFHPEMSNVQK